MDTNFDLTPTTPCPPVLWRVVARLSGTTGETVPTPLGPPALTPDAAAAAWAAARELTYAEQVIVRRVDDQDGTGPRVQVRITPRLTYLCRVASVHGSLPL